MSELLPEPKETPPAARATEHPAGTARGGTASRWRLRILVLVGLAMLALAATRYVADLRLTWQIPAADLEGVHRDVVDAIRAATAAVRQQPRSGAAWGKLGMILHAHEYYVEAAQCYRMASQLEPLEFRWPYYLANLLETEDRPSALQAFQRAIEIQPELAQLRIRIAELYLDLEQTEPAERELKKALELAPQNSQAQYRLSQLFYRQRNYPTSLEWARKAAAQKPARREVHELLLQLHHRLGQSEQAQAESQRLRLEAFAVGYWPDPYFDELKQLRRDPLWRAYQANLLLQRGQTSEAVAVLEELVEQKPDDAALREQLARTFIHAQRLDRAASALDQGLSRLPRAFELLRMRGVVHLLRSEWQPAAQCFRQALQVKSSDASVHQDLGFCLVQLKQVEPALAEFREAIRFQPDFVEPRLEIARLLLAQGQKQAAHSELQTVLELSPQNAAATELLPATEASAPPVASQK